MTDEIWARDEVQSPCIKICVVHPEERLCVGCYRTIDEIGRFRAARNHHIGIPKLDEARGIAQRMCTSGARRHD